MSTDQEAKTTTANAGLIGATALGGAIIGFFLQLLVAFHFGAGNETDAFFMAQSTSELLSKLLMGGSITAVFIPIFVERLTKDKSAAWDIALNIFHITAAIFIVATACIGIFADPFIRFIAPGFDTRTTDLTISILRILLPSFVLLFLVEMATSMLHSLKRFALPAILRLVAPTVSIMSILLVIKSLGIYALALGAVAGSLIQLVILLVGLRRQGMRYRFILKPKDPTIQKIVLLVYPFIFSALMTQGAGITYRILVSDLAPGSLAALKFAEKITQLLTIIFLNSVTLVIYPLLAQRAAEHDMLGIRKTITSAIRLITFVTLPVICGVIVLRDPLIQFIYQRGQFSAQDAAMTSIALLFLVIGLTTNGISSVLGHTVLALQQTRAAVAITIAMQATAVSLFILLVPSLAHAGLALASSLVPLSAALLYFLYLTRFIPNLSQIFRSTIYLKIAILSIGMTGTVIMIREAVDSTHPLIMVSLPTLGGILFYSIGAHVWKIPEMQNVLEIIRIKRQKWARS